jgi:hypothetical protein
MQMVAILKRVMCASSEEKAEPGLFPDCFVCRQNGFVHERVKRLGWASMTQKRRAGAFCVNQLGLRTTRPLTHQ